MKEEFLHYLWKYGLYDKERLTDPAKNKIIVIDPGQYNRDAGPDFFNARISVEGTTWAGNIEIHTKSSHFNSHGHNNDPAFNNVILHVVAENDKQVFNSRGDEILTVELPLYDEYYEKYLSLVNNPYIIACQDEIRSIDHMLIHHWLSSVLVERLQSKTQGILRIYSETGNDWEETFYRLLSRYFGFRVNTGPFEMLATALPFRIIRKHADNIFQIEALLFGTAGLLETGLFKEAMNDEYFLELAREYKVLSSKYGLKALHGWIWKFARLRPSNFPTLRLSQLAVMLTTAGGLFSKIVECEDIEQIRKLLEVSATSYWDDHYIFGKKCRPFAKHTGSQAADILLINSVIPIMFVYGRERDFQELCERALSFLEKIEPEKNIIITEWEKISIIAESAFDSQSLIHLRNEYCRKRRCLDCSIGNMIISSGKILKNEDELLLEP